MVVVGRAEGKRPLGRPLSRWEGTIKIILKEWDGRVWTGLVWLRVKTSSRLLCTQ